MRTATILSRHPWLRVLLPLTLAIGVALFLLILSRTLLGSMAERFNAAGSTEFQDPPVFIGEIPMRDHEASLHPYALALHDSRLYVSCIGSNRLYVLGDDFQLLRTVDLQASGKALIGGLAVDRHRIYVADFGSGELGIYDRDGRRVNHFALLPDGRRRLRPFNLTLFEGILYLTDPRARQVYVVTATDRGPLSEEGELLFGIEGGDSAHVPLRYPSSTYVTPDGRLLVSDMSGGNVHAFTCNGRYAYPFDRPPGSPLRAPHAIAMDNLPSPELIAEDRKVFDPSGVRRLGRIHVVDRAAGEVAVFDALGHPVFRYGAGQMDIPNGIVIDQNRRAIIIADSHRDCLLVYKY